MKTKTKPQCAFCQSTAGVRRTSAMGKSLNVCTTCAPGKPHKYRARRTIIDGIAFDSRREADTYVKLKALEQAGELTDLERQVRYDLHGKNGTKISFVKVDFAFKENGRPVVLEVKGVRTRAYVLRKKLFQDEYPEHEYREV
jgi:hypothetical protein